MLALLSCSIENPADSGKDKTEYEYNYWLLEREYYFDDLPSNNAYTEPESLYAAISDPYTRYIVPQKAEETQAAMETSINNGTTGIELRSDSSEYPLTAYRIYPGSSADRAKLPRYARLIEANGKSLHQDANGAIYKEAIAKVDTVELKYTYNNDTATVKLAKEDILIPTVFLDTLPTGNPIITLRKFAKPTYNKEFGTVGELDSILKIINDTQTPVVIDLRNNPGGLVSQCIQAADMFISEGIIMQFHTKGFLANEHPHETLQVYSATKGGLGENLNVLLVTNGNTASCAEIFTMALKPQKNVKSTGTKTHGKGIGQAGWHTKIGALAYITNSMIYDANKETYHAKGLEPDYPCESPNWSCVYNTINALYPKAATKEAATEFLEPKEILPDAESSKLGGAVFVVY